MRATGRNETGLVRAAQTGDRGALDELAAAYLPLVYNVVGRALSGHPDVDDIVQDTMLRALRELRTLRTPESFRTWLVTIAVRQVGTYLHRNRVAVWRTAALDEAADLPDSDADFEGLTILRLGLSGQRRQVARASRWLDPGDRALLSLWWLEVAGHLTRPELAAAMGISVAHAGVRVQRMSNHLELSRVLVAALEARPRCAGLSAAVAGWDGQPSPLWRKRIARHTRSCPTCGSAAEGLIPTARLLVGLALVPVPLALVALVSKSVLTGVTVSTSVETALGAGLLGKTAPLGKAGLLSQLAHTVGTHPIAAIMAAGAIVAGVVVAAPWSSSDPGNSPVIAAQTPSVTTAPASTPPAPTPTPPAPTATPTRPPATTTAPPAVSTPGPGQVALGPVSLESVDRAGSFLVLTSGDAALGQVGTNSAEPVRRFATFEVVPGLANPDCYSFRYRDGQYLRHLMWRLRLGWDDRTPLFRGDATFCARPGLLPGSVRLESANYPGRFIRNSGDALLVDPSDGSQSFRANSSFQVRSGLAK